MEKKSGGLRGKKPRNNSVTRAARVHKDGEMLGCGLDAGGERGWAVARRAQAAFDGTKGGVKGRPFDPKRGQVWGDAIF